MKKVQIPVGALLNLEVELPDEINAYVTWCPCLFVKNDGQWCWRMEVCIERPESPTKRKVVKVPEATDLEMLLRYAHMTTEEEAKVFLAEITEEEKAQAEAVVAEASKKTRGGHILLGGISSSTTTSPFIFEYPPMKKV
jgi:hypothetical protein